MPLQGRNVSPEDVAHIQQLLGDQPDWNRTRLSRELCERWDWRTPTGQMKDMACRSLLLKLEQRGLIKLPPRQRSAHVNAHRNGNLPQVTYVRDPVSGSLRDLLPLQINPVASGADRDLLRCLLGHHHYLGVKNTVGQNLAYLIRDQQQIPLGCLLFGSAAWQAADRDRFIGWPPPIRKQNLHLLTNNTRFLILPWVRVPNLASHVLSRVTQRLSQDWQDKYGHPIYAVETFVDQSRFRGTCYRAANWLVAGQTTGRTRNDRQHQLATPRKTILLYPLIRHFQRILSDG
ncbi:MAG TPA: Druantia anti-phage system protein DruA [Xanthomonadales bacterium]|nr:Druantia anti-phage system protein DruA [Xanthomonadales bacterium]